MSYKNHPVRLLMNRKTGRLRLQDIYRVYLGRREGQDVWIVDGAKVCREIYPPFIMGGNDQRYRFNPPNEVWLDNRMGVEEISYTLAHELIERKLMRERGWSYDRAHSEGGLKTERRLRAEERKRLPILGLYRALYAKVDGVSIWIVDGNAVRSGFEPDFTYGGHHFEFSFIPRDEIWLDNSISSEEAPFTVKHELVLRKLMAAGTPYDEAYELALAAQYAERDRQFQLARKHEAELEPVRYGVRERGAKQK